MFHKLVFRKRPRKKVYLKTYLSNTPNTVDQIQIQIQIHGLKFYQIQIQIQIRRICICICICKYKYVFDPSPGPEIVEILLCGWKRPVCSAASAESITWLLMAWWHKEPGHQQPWYWPSNSIIFQFQKDQLIKIVLTQRLLRNPPIYLNHDTWIWVMIPSFDQRQVIQRIPIKVSRLESRDIIFIRCEVDEALPDILGFQIGHKDIHWPTWNTIQDMLDELRHGIPPYWKIRYQSTKSVILVISKFFFNALWSIEL